MIGTLLNLMDKPLLIENSGFFVAGGWLVCMTTGVIIAMCLIWLKIEFEEVADEEAFERYQQDRFADIVCRVEQDRGALC